MYPRIRMIVVTVVIMALCPNVDQGHATVVQDGNAGPANPGVEAGGQPLDRRPPSAIPYSLFGALRDEEAWFSAYCGWPWTLFRSFHWHRHHPGTNGGYGGRVGPVNQSRPPIR